MSDTMIGLDVLAVLIPMGVTAIASMMWGSFARTRF